MSEDPPSAVIGKWRIVEMELWDSKFIDLVEPGYILFTADGLGEIVFGCVVGGLDVGFGPRSADFTWQGHDEMDEAGGDGEAWIDDDGALVGEIRFHLGDESSFKARRWP
jgi:hypothetical protein